MSARARWLAGGIAICGALAVVGRLTESGAMVWIFKPLATILILALAWQRAHARSRAAGGVEGAARDRAILLGLALSLAGDVLLIPQGLFVAGLLAFLCAHVAYLVAFTRDAPPFARLAPVLAVGAVAVAVLAALWPRLPAGLGVPVIAYVAMLGAMTAQACVRAQVRRDRHACRAALGGVLFLLSDALLAIDRFHTPLPLAALWVLGTYWPAQVAIALSIPARSAPAHDAARPAGR